MAAKPKNVDIFLTEQSRGYFAFVITPGATSSDVDVYPFSHELNILEELRLSIPKDAIETVNPVGTTAELFGRRHEVVNIVFVGDVGLAYERAFQDLIENLGQRVSVTPPVGLVDTYPKEPRPLRDWCGWHWPIR